MNRKENQKIKKIGRGSQHFFSVPILSIKLELATTTIFNWETNSVAKIVQYQLLDNASRSPNKYSKNLREITQKISNPNAMHLASHIPSLKMINTL